MGTEQALPACAWKNCDRISTRRKPPERYLCEHHAGFEAGVNIERSALVTFLRFRDPEPVLLTIEAIRNGEHRQ